MTEVNALPVLVQWWIQTGFHSFHGNPLWYYELFIEWPWFSVNVTPSLATDLRKLLLWLTLACVSRKLFENRSMGLVVSLKNNRNGRGSLQNAKISCALCAQQYNRNPFQEILDPPLLKFCCRCSNWPFRMFVLSSYCKQWCLSLMHLP